MVTTYWRLKDALNQVGMLQFPAWERQFLGLRDRDRFARVKYAGFESECWPHHHEYHRHCPHLTRPSTGEILLTHRQPSTSMHISRDYAKSWQGPIEIDSVGGAYPSTVELKDRRVLVVYYEEGEVALFVPRASAWPLMASNV
jgi:hypothetical protein